MVLNFFKVVSSHLDGLGIFSRPFHFLSALPDAHVGVPLPVIEMPILDGDPCEKEGMFPVKTMSFPFHTLAEQTSAPYAVIVRNKVSDMNDPDLCNIILCRNKPPSDIVFSGSFKVKHLDDRRVLIDIAYRDTHPAYMRKGIMKEFSVAILEYFQAKYDPKNEGKVTMLSEPQHIATWMFMLPDVFGKVKAINSDFSTVTGDTEKAKFKLFEDIWRDFQVEKTSDAPLSYMIGGRTPLECDSHGRVVNGFKVPRQLMTLLALHRADRNGAEAA